MPHFRALLVHPRLRRSATPPVLRPNLVDALSIVPKQHGSVLRRKNSARVRLVLCARSSEISNGQPSTCGPPGAIRARQHNAEARWQVTRNPLSRARHAWYVWPVSIRFGLAACAALVLVSPSADVVARTQADAATLLRAAVDADELDLAALASRIGDDGMLEALAEGKDISLRLSAVRSTPYLLNPELALVPLAQMAAGRDPDLAPAAARRALRIAQALALEDLATRELSPTSLQEAKRLLSAIANESSARPDVRLCAGQAAHLLAMLIGAR
jgi:hypothetical protein